MISVCSRNKNTANTMSSLFISSSSSSSFLSLVKSSNKTVLLVQLLIFLLLITLSDGDTIAALNGGGGGGSSSINSGINNAISVAAAAAAAAPSVSSSNSGVAAVAQNNAITEDPEFTEIIENITVPAGRNVKLACSVKNLGSYKVAWMHFEQSAILTVHNHVITRNPRISVTHDKHDKHRTWFLHINNVQEEDEGRYMCQINTITAKTQFGFVRVVVPPNIDDALTSTDIIAHEGENVTMRCHASGSPEPSIKWKRDDGRRIKIAKDREVPEWEGEVLDLEKISRLDMGAYLCIATNGIPPSVSKMIKVNVDFSPVVWVPHQLMGVAIDYNVTLECNIEANPTSLNYWTRENGQMITDSSKYKTETIQGSPSYKATMKLYITSAQRDDFGIYNCLAKNPRGHMDGSIRLYSKEPPTTLPPPTTTTLATEPTTIKFYGFTTPISPNNWQIDSKNNNYDKGLKHLPSSLNEIDKSEQKSSPGGEKSKSYTDYTPDGGANTICLHNILKYAITIIFLSHRLSLRFNWP